MTQNLLVSFIGTLIDGTRASVEFTQDGLFRFPVGGGLAPINVNAPLWSEASARRAAKRSGAGHAVNYGPAGLSKALSGKMPKVGEGTAVYANAREAILNHGKSWLGLSDHERLELANLVDSNYQS